MILCFESKFLFISLSVAYQFSIRYFCKIAKRWSMKKHVKIFTGSIILINRLSIILEEHGIISLIKDNTASARISGFGTSINDVFLYVFDSDYEKAEKLIKNYLKENN